MSENARTLDELERGFAEVQSTRKRDNLTSQVASLHRRGGGEMMKRLIVLSVVMLIALATAASAALDTAWTVKIRVTDLADQNGGNINIYGTAASTGRSSMVPSGDQVYSYITGSEPSYYFRDIKTAAPASETLVWQITVATRSTYKSNVFKLAVWNETGSANDLDDNWGGVIGTQPNIQPARGAGFDPQNAFFVRLYQGETLLYTFDPTQNGTSTTPMFTATFPIEAGALLPNFFTLKREPIPEPGSMLALASGLVGLAGFAVRRRR